MNFKKIEFMTTRYAIALSLIVAFGSVASAKTNSSNVNGRESSGFNALDHVLQKPLGNPSFPEKEKGFGKHIYFGFNAGGSYINNNLFGSWRPAYTFGAHVGGWFTPVHGLRLTGNYGRASFHGGNGTFGTVRADYMMNLSSLLYGYDPNRKFELLTGTGLMYQHTVLNGSHGNDLGLAASLQMRFNLNKSFYLFVEPEMAVLGGTGFRAESPLTHMHTELALNVGLGYRILTGRQRKAGSTRFVQSPDDNMFYGLSAGLFTFNNPDASMSPTASLFIGKMFSSTSGLQLTGRYGHIHNAEYSSHKNFGVASLDYVLNLNNAFAGYRPNTLFQVALNVGPAMAMDQNTHSFYGGFHAGLTGTFRLSPNWGIFVSPNIYAFSNRVTEKIGVGKRPMVAIDLGVRYTVGDFTRRFKNHSFDPSESVPRWFVNVGGGAGMRFRFGTHTVYDAFVGVGRRFSPISSWRVNFEYGGMNDYDYTRFTGGIDYLTSITTAMYGYKEDRLFDLQAVAGIFGGATKLDSDMKGTFGIKAGFQANFRINRNFGVYLEPQMLAVYGPYTNEYMHWAPDARVNVGLKYQW
ncbi:MAG: hypothetical protein K2M93_07465 [Muribaculaceae bacterium]|nr:hypothetical protein [Muribaculaceae bacterium]